MRRLARIFLATCYALGFLLGLALAAMLAIRNLPE